jgi:hypothetical protein
MNEQPAVVQEQEDEQRAKVLALFDELAADRDRWKVRAERLEYEVGRLRGDLALALSANR